MNHFGPVAVLVLFLLGILCNVALHLPDGVLRLVALVPSTLLLVLWLTVWRNPSK